MPRGTVLKSRSVTVGVPGTGVGRAAGDPAALPDPGRAGSADRDRDDRGQPDRPAQPRTGRLPQLLRRPRRQVLAELHAARRRPGRGQLRAGLLRDRAGPRPGGAGVRRDRAGLRGSRPALGGRPRVRLEHPRRHPRHRELPRHAQQPEGWPVRLLGRLDRRRVGERARAVVRPGAQHRRHRDRRHPGPPRAQHALRQRQRHLVRRDAGGAGLAGPRVRHQDRQVRLEVRQAGDGRGAGPVHRVVQRQLPGAAGPAAAQEEVPRLPQGPPVRPDHQPADHGEHAGPPADADVHGRRERRRHRRQRDDRQGRAGAGAPVLRRGRPRPAQGVRRRRAHPGRAAVLPRGDDLPRGAVRRGCRSPATAPRSRSATHWRR